jgi:hypothetical protein
MHFANKVEDYQHKQRKQAAEYKATAHEVNSADGKFM